MSNLRSRAAQRSFFPVRAGTWQAAMGPETSSPPPIPVGSGGIPVPSADIARQMQAAAQDQAAHNAADIAQAGVDKIRKIVIGGVVGVALIAAVHLYYSRK